MRQFNLHRRADRVRTPRGGIRNAGARSLSQVGSELINLLPLEAQIRWHGHRRVATTAAAGGRESPVSSWWRI